MPRLNRLFLDAVVPNIIERGPVVVAFTATWMLVQPSRLGMRAQHVLAEFRYDGLNRRIAKLMRQISGISDIRGHHTD